MNQISKVFSTAISHQRTPLVLTIVSCTGVVVTAIMAAKAAPKASRVLEQLREDHIWDADTLDHVPIGLAIKRTWKFYAPAVGVGIITIASIVTMNQITERNAALLTASAALATSTLKDYQQHVLEEIGAEKESKIRDHIAKDSVRKYELSDETAELFVLGGEGDTYVYDSLSGRYFKKSVEDIRAIENDMNREILSQDYVSLNTLYEALGLEPIEVGEMLGFNTDNMVDIHYSAQLDPKKRPVLVLGYINMPVVAYNTF